MWVSEVWLQLLGLGPVERVMKIGPSREVDEDRASDPDPNRDLLGLRQLHGQIKVDGSEILRNLHLSSLLGLESGLGLHCHIWF